MFKTNSIRFSIGVSLPMLLLSAAAQSSPNDIHRAIEAGRFWRALDIARQGCYHRYCNLNDIDWNGRTPLVLAAQSGATDLALYLIDRGVNLNAQDIEGNTALMYATRNMNKKLVKALVKKGAKVDYHNNFGNTALMWAVKDKWNPAMSGQFSIFKTLLNSKVHCNYGEFRSLYDYINHGNKEENTALMWAARAGNSLAMSQLIQFGAEVNRENEHGRTALIWASENGEYDATLVLVNAGAKVDHFSRIAGKSAIQYARAKGHGRIVQFLKQAAHTQACPHHPVQAPSSQPAAPCNFVPFPEASEEIQAPMQTSAQAVQDQTAQAQVLAQAFATALTQALGQPQNVGPTVGTAIPIAAPAKHLEKNDDSEISMQMNSAPEEEEGFRATVRHAIKTAIKDGHHNENEVAPL